MDKLDSHVLEQRSDLVEELADLDNLLEDRITYIVQQIIDKFDSKCFAHWSYVDTKTNFEHNEVTIIDALTYDNRFIAIEGVGEDTSAPIWFTDASKHHNLFIDGIPTRWLWEDFEEELKEARQRFVDEMERRKEARKQKKQMDKVTKEKLVQAVKDKLSVEELAVVSFKKK